MNTCKLILVGGFLGAGKTSLLWRAAELLKAEGQAVGLITNDQATDLVDTAFLEDRENLVREVSGSCFCCNFNGFADAIAYIADKNAGGTILAEPVGSCTDLSATLMQPLKDKYADSVDLAPLTVLADPERLSGILDGADSPAAYIGSKQFEEADIILINKVDLLDAATQQALQQRAIQKWPQARVLLASVKDGTGIAEWLTLVQQIQEAGTHLAEVDYDIYADGEAAYGWLNTSYKLQSTGEFAKLAQALLEQLSAAFDSRDAAVGHVKFLLQTADHQWIGNLTGKAQTASLRDQAHAAEQPMLTVNARVEMGPNELNALVQQAVRQVFADVALEQTANNCLIPGRPNPTYRYQEVIAKA